MENKDILLNNLTGKDETAGQIAADYLINNADTELFQKLVDKTESLFDFVKSNVLKRLGNSITKDNFKNVINFFGIYSPYYDDFFADVLAKHANEDLTDEILEILEKGTLDQKTYAAKYFKYIPDTVSIEFLSKYAFSDNEFLSFNAAESLGQMQDDISYDIALGLLKGNDEFDKLKAVRFFTAYGKNHPMEEIFNTIKTSRIAENLAGLIPYMQSFSELVLDEKTKENALITLDYILSGLGEILPLSDIFQFELFDITEKLIEINKAENEFCGLIALVLLKMYAKFNLFTENQEYIYDESKETKHEINSIFTLLKNQDEEFWRRQKQFIILELNTKERNRIISALSVIIEYKITSTTDTIKKVLSETEDEIIICEALNTLHILGCLSKEDIDKTADKIKNPNIKAIIDNML